MYICLDSQVLGLIGLVILVVAVLFLSLMLARRNAEYRQLLSE
ncbi:hypothetical protein KIPB_016489, partial [Kipferlia bialata]|eukprot:g16489.t1